MGWFNHQPANIAFKSWQPVVGAKCFTAQVLGAEFGVEKLHEKFLGPMDTQMGTYKG